MKLISAVAIQILAIALREASKPCGVNPISPPIEIICNCTGQEVGKPDIDWKGTLILVICTSFEAGVGLTVILGWWVIGWRYADRHNSSRRRGGGVLEIPDAR